MVSAPEDRNLIQKGKRGLFHIIFSRTMIILMLLVLNFFIFFSWMYDWLIDIPLLFGSVEAFTIVMLVHVLNSRDNPSVKLTWCLLITAVPLLGTILYFWTRYDLGHRLNQKMVESSIRGSIPFIPEQRQLMEQVRREDPALGNLAAYLRRCSTIPIYANTQVRYFPLGEDKFAEMLIQLEKAEKFIFLEYFIIHEGYMWNTVLEILQRKAKQGVEIRVLYDGMNAIANLPYGYPKELEKMGIRCKMFSPVQPLVSTHYNNRDHRKILVIDGHTAFTGGINLEDRYINIDSPYGHWKDTAIMVQGEAAQGFTLMFLQMWNATENVKTITPYLHSSLSVPAGGYVIPFGDTPTDRENVGEMVYLDILNRAERYVWIMTPYLVIDNEIATALTYAARRGVDVRLILPHIPDKKAVFVMTRSHYRELLDAGVRIYEYTPGFVHAKVFLSDDKCAVVGTINLDYRSLYHHFECGAYLYKVPALKDIRNDFDQTIAQCQQISEASIREFPLWQRILGRILKVFAPLV